ncbi:hypothetical protein [Paenibacillus piri]|uniref:Uncharacterized protein n=1 Tax=Paenibacillus piri TaxID=2547395 RepID=A0A4R5KFA9_9BACL|nr:hypothetical protein [Paenibacillus piri]TDF92947.1 hypothetical protein E1757_28100 [Paenibacillus piri]
MNKNHLFIALGAVVFAIFLQFVSVGLLGNSVVSNIPILGELLTVIDFLFLFNYLNDGLDLYNIEQVVLRVISLAATAYTLIILNEWGFDKLNELFNDSPDYARIIKVITIVVAIIIHYFVYFILHAIYIDIFYQIIHKVQIEFDKVKKQIQYLKY